MAELAAEADFSEARINQLVELAEDPVSLDTHVGESDSLYGELIEDTNGEAPHEATEFSLQRRDLWQALQSLEPRPRHVLELRFGLAGSEPQTLAEIGDGLGLTRERVRQIEARALRELRLLAPGLELYLAPD